MELAKTKPADRFQQRREQTRSELLSAARRVLGANGYHRAKVADIARAANVGVGTFYLYYPTKEALFLELVDDMVRLMRADLEAATRDITDPIDRIRTRHEAFFRFAERHVELFRIVFVHGKEFHDVVARAQDLFIGDIVGDVREGIRRGEVRQGDPELLAHAIVGVGLQAVDWWIKNTRAIPVEQVAAESFVLMADGLRHGR